jgi:hypothetical protein
MEGEGRVRGRGGGSAPLRRITIRCANIAVEMDRRSELMGNSCICLSVCMDGCFYIIYYRFLLDIFSKSSRLYIPNAISQQIKPNIA